MDLPYPRRAKGSNELFPLFYIEKPEILLVSMLPFLNLYKKEVWGKEDVRIRSYLLSTGLLKLKAQTLMHLFCQSPEKLSFILSIV